MVIRVLLGIMGMDQHEVGAISVARIFRDAGMEIIYVGRFNTPSSILRAAIAEDVDIIGLSCHSWEYIEYIPELLKLMNQEGVDMGVVAGGSVITPADAKKLMNEGVAAVFGPDKTKEMIVDQTKAVYDQRTKKQ